MLKKFQKTPENSNLTLDLCGKSLAELQGSNSIIIFGAGSATKEILPLITDIIKIQVRFVLDNKASFIHELYGHEVVNPNKAEIRKNDHIVVFATSNRAEIKSQLDGLKINEENVFFPKIEHLQFYSHVFQWYLDERLLLKQERRIKQTYDLLHDEHSKTLFLSRLGLLSNYPDYESFKDFVNNFSLLPDDDSFFDKRAPETFLYFNNNRITKLNSTLIDVGVCFGDSIHHYTKKNQNKFDQIIGFEPDQKNFKILKGKYQSDKRIQLFNFAAWDKKQDLKFVSIGTGISCVDGADETEKEFKYPKSLITSVQAVTLDSLKIKNQHGIIQMDVEGSESRVITGMQETLLNNHFELIVSCYHKKFDMVDLILQINDIKPDYNFSLELLSDSLLELNIFATIQTKRT